MNTKKLFALPLVFVGSFAVAKTSADVWDSCLRGVLDKSTRIQEKDAFLLAPESGEYVFRNGKGEFILAKLEGKKYSFSPAGESAVVESVAYAMLEKIDAAKVGASSLAELDNKKKKLQGKLASCGKLDVAEFDEVLKSSLPKNVAGFLDCSARFEFPAALGKEKSVVSNEDNKQLSLADCETYARHKCTMENSKITADIKVQFRSESSEYTCKAGELKNKRVAKPAAPSATTSGSK